MKDQALYDLLEMLQIEPGEFTTDSTKVTLSRRFELGRFPVTNLIWSLVMNKPLGDADLLLPKNRVSWFDAAKFCASLNKALGLSSPMIHHTKTDTWNLDLDSTGFRLPTEAEWEYSCRAGLDEERYGPLDDIAWHEGNTKIMPQPVGLKLPNPWGFHDMLGNTYEWCWDEYNSEQTKGVDPIAPESELTRTLRGGRFLSSPDMNIGASKRAWAYPDQDGKRLGFRLARSAN